MHREGPEELRVVIVGQGREFRYQHAAARGQRQGLGAAVLRIGAPHDQFLVDQPVGEFGDRSPRHADTVGKPAGRHPALAEQPSHGHPFGHCHTPALQLAGKGL